MKLIEELIENNKINSAVWKTLSNEKRFSVLSAIADKLYDEKILSLIAPSLRTSDNLSEKYVEVQSNWATNNFFELSMYNLKDKIFKSTISNLCRFLDEKECHNINDLEIRNLVIERILRQQTHIFTQINSIKDFTIKK